MNSIKTVLKSAFIIGVIGLLINCSSTPDEEIIINQFAVDSVIIADYITDKGYDPTQLDTAGNIVIYTIIDEGDGETLQYDDIVSYYFVLSLTSDSIIITNQRSVAIENDILDDSETTVI